MTVLDTLATRENFKTWTFEKATEVLNDAERRERRAQGDHRRFDYPFGEGPWDDEPDKVQWVDPATGYDCLIVRNRLGALCGYVGVPPEHPWHGIHYSDCLIKSEHKDSMWCEHTPESKLSVHGGITFTDFCEPGEPVQGICHVAGEGRPEKVFWFGFDCAHAWDLVPGMRVLNGSLGLNRLANETYRDLAYVVGEIEDLAKQLASVEAL